MTDTIMMGSERLEKEDEKRKAKEAGLPSLGVGRDCVIERTILDANVRIGDGVHLSPEGVPEGFTEGDIMVRDGVLIVRKGGIVPPGTRIEPRPISRR